MLDNGFTKSYFDDIIGKAEGGTAPGGVSDFDGLRRTWRRLLELAAKHGWKFKPAKTKWGFAKIETVGFEWSSDGISVGQKMTNAVRDLTFPRTKSELRGLLGLANQFRERIAGYALLVTALTALTRGPDRKIVATPEALIEFENLKLVLNSPPVLQQFRYDRPTFVYTDASVGSRIPGGSDQTCGDTDVPGGLGVVIVQTDVDGCDYVCAYASVGLTPAQRNYHIVRLELLAFVFACGKFYDWLAGISFVWRSDCRAHEFLHTAKTSANPTIARYALSLAEFNFRVEWIPGLTMIADSFSRLMLASCAPSGSISLPENVFGIDIGKRVHASKHGSVVTPLLLFQPTSVLVVEAPLVVNVEVEVEGWVPVDVIGRVEVPSTSVVDGLDFGVLYDVPFYSCTDAPPPVIEELSVWPELTLRETVRLRALPYLRRWIGESHGILPGNGDQPIPPELIPSLCEMGKKAWIGEDGKLWKNTRRGYRVEVVDASGRLREVLLMCHEGMGHRQLGLVYDYFSRRYWVPGAAKLIRCHILTCGVYQQYAVDLSPPHASPGFSPSAQDVFTHWSIDFACPFPPDATSGHKYIVVAVEWVTRWAEPEVVADATAATAADFIYSRVIARYGCVASIKSDNGPHFVNEIIRHLTQTFGVRHRLLTPYYPQSNGKVERVIGTLKSMLKRTVAAAVVAQSRPSEDGIKVVGIGLDLDSTILDAITAASTVRVDASGAEIDEAAVDLNAPVYWSPLVYTVLWVYRASPHNATGLSPALLALGRELVLPMDTSAVGDLAPLTDEEHRALIARRLG